MRKVFIYTVVVLGLFVSCTAQKISQEMMYGTFTGSDISHTIGSTYTLNLKSDGTFTFNRRVHLAGSHCDGRWTVDDNKLLLECSEVTDPMEELVRGGMNGVQEIRIISANKLKYHEVLLKRKSN